MKDQQVPNRKPLYHEFFSPCQVSQELNRGNKKIAALVVPRMDRGFFKTQGDWTCYRRNYFQVSLSLLLSDQDNSLTSLHLDGNPIVGFKTGLRAQALHTSKPVELIQHSSKRDKSTALPPPIKEIFPGGNPSNFDRNAPNVIATFERIQFKAATPNNGKKRANQQYFILIVEVLAQLERGQLVAVSCCTSAPLVVRGRSPSHYQDEQHIELADDIITGQPRSPMIPTTPPRGNNVQSRYAPYRRDIRDILPLSHYPSNTKQASSSDPTKKLMTGALGTFIPRETLKQIVEADPIPPGLIKLPALPKPKSTIPRLDIPVKMQNPSISRLPTPTNIDSATRLPASLRLPPPFPTHHPHSHIFDGYHSPKEEEFLYSLRTPSKDIDFKYSSQRYIKTDENEYDLKHSKQRYPASFKDLLNSPSIPSPTSPEQDSIHVPSYVPISRNQGR